jgi:hypothetical protein
VRLPPSSPPPWPQLPQQPPCHNHAGIRFISCVIRYRSMKMAADAQFGSVITEAQGHEQQVYGFIFRNLHTNIRLHLSQLTHLHTASSFATYTPTFSQMFGRLRPSTLIISTIHSNCPPTPPPQRLFVIFAAPPTKSRPAYPLPITTTACMPQEVVLRKSMCASGKLRRWLL